MPHSELQKAYERINNLDKTINNPSQTQEIRDLRQTLKEIELKLNTDEKTGILSKTGLEKLLTTTTNSQWPSGIIYIDMMGLKEINDKYGHNVGDIQINQVAYGLKHVLRSSKEAHGNERRMAEKENIGSPDLIFDLRSQNSDVGRMYSGGDEFIGVLQNIEGYNGLRTAMERLSEHFNSEDLPAISIGGTVHAPNSSIEDSIRLAEEAMYESKNALKTRRDNFSLESYDTGYAINYPNIGINIYLPKTDFLTPIKAEIAKLKKVN